MKIENKNITQNKNSSSEEEKTPLWNGRNIALITTAAAVVGIGLYFYLSKNSPSNSPSFLVPSKSNAIVPGPTDYSTEDPMFEQLPLDELSKRIYTASAEGNRKDLCRAIDKLVQTDFIPMRPEEVKTMPQKPISLVERWILPLMQKSELFTPEFVSTLRSPSLKNVSAHYDQMQKFVKDDHLSPEKSGYCTELKERLNFLETEKSEGVSLLDLAELPVCTGAPDGQTWTYETHVINPSKTYAMHLRNAMERISSICNSQFPGSFTAVPARKV